VRQPENISLEQYNFEINHSAGLVAMSGERDGKDTIFTHEAIDHIDALMAKIK